VKKGKKYRVSNRGVEVLEKLCEICHRSRFIVWSENREPLLLGVAKKGGKC